MSEAIKKLGKKIEEKQKLETPGASFNLNLFELDKIAKKFDEIKDAVHDALKQRGTKKGLVEEPAVDFESKEGQLIQKREGALTLAEQAKAANDDDEYAKHAAAFERFHDRIVEIEASQERLGAEIEEASGTMDRYMLQLTDMQAEIEKLPQEKAEAIADFVSAKQIIELNDRLQGLETSIDRGPISAVMDANRKLTAKARITEKLAGADVRVQDKAYERAGRVSTARSKMDEMLAARAAEKEKPEEAPEEEKVDTRPEI